MLKVLGFLLLMTGAAYAISDQIVFDQITSDDLGYIQQGWGPDTGQCAVDQIREIGPDPAWIVLLNDGKPEITLQKKDGSIVVICGTDGKREISNGNGTLEEFDQSTPYVEP